MLHPPARRDSVPSGFSPGGVGACWTAPREIHAEGMELSQEVKADPRRALPAVDRLASAVRARHPDLPGWAIAAGVRETLERERERLAQGGDLLGDLVSRVAHRAGALAAPHPRRVVNATGIVLHTNLGRAPMAPGAAAAAAAAASVYTDLELDLATGGRGDRLGPVAAKLRLLSGAE